MNIPSQRWVHHRGELARGNWESVVDTSTPGWAHTGLKIAEVGAGGRLELDETGIEQIIIPLAGSFSVVTTEDERDITVELAGRVSVFAGPTDVLYLSAEATASITGHGRVAVATSPTSDIRPSRYIPADQISVELRGAGASSRQVHNFGTPQALDAARLIVCEVLTPAQNWSSYPPHKHDEHRPGSESRLEEIYYFEAAPIDGSVASPDAAFGLFSAYSSPAGHIDVNTTVRTGDITLIPFGYHGPAVAAPGYDLYYLNVMAGPDPDRVWLITDDPAHAWVRDTWADQKVDARLPLHSSAKGSH